MFQQPNISKHFFLSKNVFDMVSRRRIVWIVEHIISTQKYIGLTVYIGFCDYGYSGQSGYSDRSLVDGPLSLYNNDLGYNDLQFCHF